MIFFKTPEFWYKDPGLLRKLCLKPISEIYRAISNYRYHLPCNVSLFGKKVIAVGGITIGGSGKTVVVSSICKILKENNKKFAILSRGYGRKSSEALKVDNNIHSYEDVGDEPLMLSRQFDVFVGKDRAETADMAENVIDSCEYLILDDGLTQKYLEPTKKIIVVNNDQLFGNGEMFPLGPNRLDFNEIKSDIDALLVLKREGDDNIPSFGDIPVCCGNIKQNFDNISGRLMVFCGLGYPQKFFQIFSNFEVAKTIAFPDHYPYKDEEVSGMLEEAFRLRAQLVTTEKDLMRIPKKYWSQIKTVGVDIIWESPIDFLFDF
ncbi:MAG: tetraacyldisaccharide 4'-kinase [Alphaproteobacteria bacterium]|nr:tetraacyldisaccharide 4'-kinase [Alphaproteobacteria bacterium]